MIWPAARLPVACQPPWAAEPAVAGRPSGRLRPLQSAPRECPCGSLSIPHPHPHPLAHSGRKPPPIGMLIECVGNAAEKVSRGKTLVRRCLLGALLAGPHEPFLGPNGTGKQPLWRRRTQTFLSSLINVVKFGGARWPLSDIVACAASKRRWRAARRCQEGPRGTGVRLPRQPRPAPQCHWRPRASIYPAYLDRHILLRIFLPDLSVRPGRRKGLPRACAVRLPPPAGLP